MTLIAGVVAGAMTLSAFTKPTKVESSIEIAASPVWEGYALANGAGGKYENMMSGSASTRRIRVYPSDNSCGAYYAVTLNDYGKEGDIHYTVKSNPKFDYSSQNSRRVEYYSHYITIGSSDFFFKM